MNENEVIELLKEQIRDYKQQIHELHKIIQKFAVERSYVSTNVTTTGVASGGSANSNRYE